MRALIISALFTAVSGFAFADGHADALARLEAGTEKMTNNLLDFYVSRVPSLEDVRPDMSWDAEFRDAGQCILDGLDTDGGPTAVADYLAALEEFADAEIVNFTDMTTQMPAALSSNVVLGLSNSCGMIRIGTERMAASGLNDAFAQDGVMQKVLAPAE